MTLEIAVGIIWLVIGLYLSKESIKNTQQMIREKNYSNAELLNLWVATFIAGLIYMIAGPFVLLYIFYKHKKENGN